MRISDWSSDVCSSDLRSNTAERSAATRANRRCSGSARTAAALATSTYGCSNSPMRILVSRIGRTASSSSACVIRSEEHTSELQSLMRTSYAVFCLIKKTEVQKNDNEIISTKN